MSADSVSDKFQALGAAPGTADTQSPSPVGTPAVPPADQRLVYTPVAGGTPAPAP